MTQTTTYAELLNEVSISITPNDAAFLAGLLQNYIYKEGGIDTLLGDNHLTRLLGTLRPKAGC